MSLGARNPVIGGGGIAKNKGADQPANPRSQISAFVVRIFGSMISKLATSEILIFKVVSVAEQAGLKLTFRNPLRQVLSRRGPFYLINWPGSEIINHF